MAFVKDDPAKAAGLVAHIQKLTEANKAKDLRSFVVFMGGPEMKGALEKLAADRKITIAVSFLPAGAGQADIVRYKVNPEAKNTVLVYRRQKVTAAFADVDEKSFDAVEKATAAMLAE